MKAHAKIARQRIFDEFLTAEGRIIDARNRLNRDDLKSIDVHFALGDLIRAQKHLVEAHDDFMRLFAFTRETTDGKG